MRAQAAARSPAGILQLPAFRERVTAVWVKMPALLPYGTTPGVQV